LLVDAPIARGDDQHRAIVVLAAEDHALGDLPQRHAQGVGRFLRSARRDVQPARCVPMAQLLQCGADALEAFRSCFG
jgi:hypothetical protein